ncbi:MAG: beta-ketoacyl-ACP synthase II, partial [Eubacteriaceae bacterium]
MENRRVVITGMGAVTPIGQQLSEITDSLRDGHCAIAPITAFDTQDYKVKLAAEVGDYVIPERFSKKDFKFNDRFQVFARIAAHDALADSGLTEEDLVPERFGVNIGSGVGGLGTIEKNAVTLHDRGPRRVSPFFIPMALINLSSGSIAMDCGAHGYVTSTVTACAAGANAIGDSFRRIRAGYEDVIIAGGAESSVTTLGIAGFMAMRALYEGDNVQRASIPFDPERSGFVMGEGAGMLILEDLEHAKKRGAKIYAEVVGYGASCDAHHVTAPDPDGLYAANAMKEALSEAGIESGELGYVNAHGTSTQLNETSEAKAMKIAFGSDYLKPFVSSTKSMTGHMLGASGAAEAVFTVLAMNAGFIPPTVNTEKTECDVNLVMDQAVDADFTYAMSNSL